MKMYFNYKYIVKCIIFVTLCDFMHQYLFMCGYLKSRYCYSKYTHIRVPECGWECMTFVCRSPHNRVNIIYEFPNDSSRKPIPTYEVYISQILERVSSVPKNAISPKYFPSFSAKHPESRHYSMFTSIVTPVFDQPQIFDLRRAQSYAFQWNGPQSKYLT